MRCGPRKKRGDAVGADLNSLRPTKNGVFPRKQADSPLQCEYFTPKREFFRIESRLSVLTEPYSSGFDRMFFPSGFGRSCCLKLKAGRRGSGSSQSP